MRMAVITLALLVSTSAWAKTDKSYDAVIADKFFLSGECVKYLAPFSDEDREALIRISTALEIEEQLYYVTSQDTLAGRLEPALKAKGVVYNSELMSARNSEYGKRDIAEFYEDEQYSSKTALLSTTEYNLLLKGKSKELKKTFYNYVACKVVADAVGVGEHANYFEKYIDFVKSRPSKAEVGHFEVSANKAYATNKVGTGNQFAEPKQWEGSRFFVVNASFKNLDTESRLPVGGSLFINYNGKDYEFDTVEPIMLEGYNIWFKSINPLITMKTKIVYRIPNEVHGEVFWKPGRNPNDTRLWVGKVSSVE